MAGSDASIYGLIRPQPIVPLRDPQEMALRRMQLQNAERAGRLGDLQLQESQDDISRAGQLRDLFARGTNPTAEQVMAIDPVKLGPAYLKQRGETSKGEQELLTKDRENYVALATQAFKERQTIRTPEEWARHRDNLLASAGMFKTKEMRDFAMRTVAALPAQYDPQFIARSLAEGKEVFTPKMTERTDGARKWMEDTNPFTNPAILRGAEAKVQMSPSEKDSSARGWATLNQPVWSDERGVFVPRPAAGGRVGAPTAGAVQTTSPAAPIKPPGLGPKWVNNFERGLQVNSDTGETRPMTEKGAPIGAKDKDLTDAQSKALLYSNRMEDAEKIITDLAAQGRTKSTPGSRDGFGIGATINVLNTSAGRQLDQAKRNFINALLRRESGAVISPSEFENAELQYFPQVGDDDATIANKAANRRTAIEGIRAEVPESKRPKSSVPTPDKSVPDSPKPSAAPTRADIDAELRRRGVIK